MWQSRIIAQPERLDGFCKSHSIRRLSLFGSILREDFTDASDVDVLVEFEPDAHVGLIRKAEIGLALGDLWGREVDLRTPAELSRHIRERVLAESRDIYVRRR